MAYVFVTGNFKVTAPITVEDSIKKFLWWIGFTTKEQKNIIYDYSINFFSDMRIFTEKYTSDLSTGFSGSI